MKPKKLIFAALLFAVLFFAGCGEKHPEIFTLAEMKDLSLTVAVPSDIEASDFVLEACPNAQLINQDDVMYGVRSVSEGKVDVFAVGRVYIEKAVTEGSIPNIRILDEPLHVYECALGMSELCTIPNFQSIVNATVSRFSSDGTIEEMRARWFEKEDLRMPQITLDENPVYTVNVVTYGQCKPYSFFAGGALTGFDVELAYRLCQANHWGLRLDYAEYPGMLMGLSTGKFDLVSANLYLTENRMENIVFSVPYAKESISVAVRDFSVPASAGSPSFPDRVLHGLRRTFVEEDRWKTIVSGLGTTILITLGSFLIANLLGAGLCACALSKKKALQTVNGAYGRILQGTPIVVLLMIFYYVIFGKSDIPGVLVAIFAFGLNSAASLSQQFRGAIASVGKDQMEAALALGFPKARAFCGIVLPQAARAVLPGYFSEIINLMKGTAIVGYITVIDLTKSGDLIRSSTYDAFFPLLSVAFIYFLLSFGLLSLLKFFLKKLSPKRAASREVAK